MRILTVLAFVLVLATTAYGLDHKAMQMREDFGTQPLAAAGMSYWYYIPCTSTGGSWFWMWSGWNPGDIVGVFFTVGDPTMYTTPSAACPPYKTLDPLSNHVLEQIMVLDFAGYGTAYPGLFTTSFDVWCADAQGCPVGPSLWNSGPVEFCTAGWNYVVITPGLCLSDCYTELVGNIKAYPRFLVTATMTGTLATYPGFGFDNIYRPLFLSCVMHDRGCCPALYPRPAVSHYSTMHTGYYGPAFANCPPQWFSEDANATNGYLEMAWRVYLNNIYTATETSTWGNIKSMYK